MTVKQLIHKLNKMPEDASVVISNCSLFKNGIYEVTGIRNINLNGDKLDIEITTNYSKLIKEIKDY